MIKYDLLKLSFIQNFHNEIVCRIQSNSFWYSKIRLLDKNKKMFSFLPLINISVTVGYRFYCQPYQQLCHQKRSISCIFLFVLYSSIFSKYQPYHLSFQSKLQNQYNLIIIQINKITPAPLHFLIKNWYFASYGSLAYKQILSLYCL